MLTKINVTNLKKNFGDKAVLNGIDLQVNKGESLVILGGSGSGKSVLIKIIAGIIAPSYGSIVIDGEETALISDKKRDDLMVKFGFLFQGGALFDSLPVWENVAFRLINGVITPPAVSIPNVRGVTSSKSKSLIFSFVSPEIIAA